MKRLSLAGSFKSHVFPEVGYPLIGGRLIPTANVKHNSAMNNPGAGNLVMNNPNAILQRIYFVLSHSGTAKVRLIDVPRPNNIDRGRAPDL